MTNTRARHVPGCRGRALAFGFVLLCAFVGPALAQIPQQVTGPTDSVGPPASGPGRLRGQVVPADAGDSVAGLPIVLYALQPDGTPGLANTETDASGHFVFTNLSTQEGLVYLLGTRMNEVPFGQRVVFSAGETELVTEIELQAIRDDASVLRVSQILWLLDWVGAQLLVQVAQQVTNDSDHVVFVSEADREGRAPLFEARLPENMVKFLGAGDGLSTRPGGPEEGLLSWGPFYPGEQELRYGFLAEAGEDGDTVSLEQVLAQGAEQVVVGVPEGSPAPEAGVWLDTGETITVGKSVYRRFESGQVRPGGRRRIALTPPASSQDASTLRVARADYWIDHDDTEIRVNAQLQLEVDAGHRLMAPPGQFLLHIDLPAGAEFQGLTAGTGALGVVPGQFGGLDVRGPLPSGASSVGYSYRMPVQEVAALDLRVSKEVETMNVLVADNGVIIRGDRLHRQRPFKQGTRFYLHRQAYQVGPGESVRVELIPIGRSGLPREAARVAALVAGVLTALFLVSPLRSKRTETVVDDASAALAREREGVYESIRDVEDDFATGKLDEADYQSLRSELRASAVALMRQQQALDEAQTTAARSEEDEARKALGIGSIAMGKDEAPTRLCLACGHRLQPEWTFCSDCGAAIAVSEKPA